MIRPMIPNIHPMIFPFILGSLQNTPMIPPKILPRMGVAAPAACPPIGRFRRMAPPLEGSTGRFRNWKVPLQAMRMAVLWLETPRLFWAPPGTTPKQKEENLMVPPMIPKIHPMIPPIYPRIPPEYPPGYPPGWASPPPPPVLQSEGSAGGLRHWKAPREGSPIGRWRCQVADARALV